MRFARMTKGCAIAATTALICISTSARAQTPDLDAARVQALQQQLYEARLQAAETQREAFAASTRANTQTTLNALQSARDAAARQPVDPFVAPPSDNPADKAFDELASQQAQAADRILQLQDEALARSNARILAVRPAL